MRKFASELLGICSVVLFASGTVAVAWRILCWGFHL